MKKYGLKWMLFVVILGLLLAACQPATPATPSAGEKAGYPAPTSEGTAPQATAYPAATQMTVRVATDATFPPFELVDEATKELTGFDVELMNAIAQKAGFKIEWTNLPFDPMLAGLSECQYDAAIAAITITDERKQSMLFSEPYINAGQIVVVRKGETRIKSKDDLGGMTVGAQLGTTGAIEAQKIPGVTFKPYDTYDLAFLDLANGQIDAVIADYPTALGFIGKNPEKLTTVGEVFTEESYGIAICKNRSDLVDKINTALKALKEEGFIQQLEQKWLASQ
ncbi:basic amino acid ABC transporter substrate-binding protein [uncultured Thermanaerothrix sp.]|uniref:basic amino acid ABC transporter substrate-binding protein n=1 Tax=uncultured Thermanaerothrix sp. TaxID=1195149 RepID=UPI0026028815|nr:basic amino acid ABC transporter substrate-binding protein [uncultured Thermanaerothrix sp.]